MNLLYIKWNVDPVIFTIPGLGFDVRWYSLMFALGFILSFIIIKKIFIKERKDVGLLDPLLMYIFAGTIIGMRAGELFYSDMPLIEVLLPVEMVDGKMKFTGFRGLASHGGIAGLILAVFIFSKVKEMNFLWLLDRLCIPAALVCGLIRLGNFFNHEIYGLPTDKPWGVMFLRDIEVANEVRHPTQLYESICYLLFFVFIYNFYNKKWNTFKPGTLFGLTLVVMFIARFLTEYTKKVYEVGDSFVNGISNINMGQFLSIPFIIIGLGILIYNSKQKQNV